MLRVRFSAFTIFKTAGTGTGSTPCWHLTVPTPSYNAGIITSSIARLSMHTAAATISTIESTAPTSWK